MARSRGGRRSGPEHVPKRLDFPLMQLTTKQIEALDMLLEYVIQSEESDYYERLEDGDSVEDHVYKCAMTLSEAFK